jgi:hypothetical protein
MPAASCSVEGASCGSGLDQKPSLCIPATGFPGRRHTVTDLFRKPNSVSEIGKGLSFMGFLEVPWNAFFKSTVFSSFSDWPNFSF